MIGGEPDEILARVASDRASVYAFLSVGFYLPEASLVWDLREGSYVGGLEVAIAWLGPDAAPYRPHLADLRAATRTMAARPAADVLHELRVEHARLFTGPGRPEVGAFESEHLDRDGDGPGRLDGPSSRRVAAWYRAAGFARAAAHHDLPDHVATELEFLHALARDEAARRREGRIDDASELRRVTDRFLREHAGRWMPEFGRAALAATTNPFYRSLAGLLIVHIAMELGEGFDRTALPWAGDPAKSRTGGG